MEIQRHEGGWGWLVNKETGEIYAERKPQPEARLTYTRETGPPVNGLEPLYLYRTRGEPSSIRAMYDEHWDAIEEACDRWALPPQWLMALIGIEATPGDGYRWNPRCVREEPGYVSDEKTPRKVSPGLLQTLISTARGEADKRGLYEDETIDREFLFDAGHSCMIGGAYYARQLRRYEGDPLKACAAYNAGSCRSSNESGWNMRMYSPTRADRFIAWANDAVFVLGELGIWTGAP